MTDTPQTPSGSRWEPQDDQPTAEQPEQPATVAESTDTAGTAGPTGTAEPPTYGPVGAAARRPSRTTLVLAGAALGLALVAGTGGFALGHATADTDPPTSQVTQRDDQAGRRGVDGDRQGGPGVTPRDGAVPHETFPEQAQPDPDGGLGSDDDTGSST